MRTDTLAKFSSAALLNVAARPISPRRSAAEAQLRPLRMNWPPSVCATALSSLLAMKARRCIDSSSTSALHAKTARRIAARECSARSQIRCSVTYSRTYDDLTDEGFASPPADGGPTGEADPATVSSFRLDKYLVTVGRFRQFVNAVLPPDGGAGWLPPAGSGKHVHLNGGQGLVNVGVPVDAGVAYEPGWVATDDGNVAPTDANLTTACLVPDKGGATWTPSVGQESLPINCVNWYEAYAFCIWDGGFLPSEAEWEYAAAGGSQQREYPWGSAAPGTANQYAIYGNYYPSGTESSAGVANIAPVGTATLGAGL
jgi:sulfatase modifying factor 1